MIKIETLKQVTHIYCHGHCPDGLASAMILKAELTSDLSAQLQRRLRYLRL